MYFLLFLFLNPFVVIGYNYLIYSPIFAPSHTVFLAKIADTLTLAGHNVTVILPIINPLYGDHTGLRHTKNFIKLEPHPKTAAVIEKTTHSEDRWLDMNPFISAYLFLQTLAALGEGHCEGILGQEKLISELRSKKFDVAIAEPFFICGFGLFEKLGIKTVIGADSTVRLEVPAFFLGQPLTPSYVPSLGSGGIPETLLERIKNLIELMIGSLVMYNVHAAEGRIMEKLGCKTKWQNQLKQISFMFTNSNPYLNFPMPSMYKIVEIGGITLEDQIGIDSELNEELSQLLSKRKYTVFMSFGSLTRSTYMPNVYKSSLVRVFAAMPDVTFIWKYEQETNITSHLSNVHIAQWLPQKKLLADPRLTIFITHGGLGSTTEVAFYGKPAILIPLFGDQRRNAEMLALHGGGIVLQKSDLGDSELLIQTIRSIINDRRYSEKANKLAQSLRNKPISNADLIVKHAEYAAKFGPLRRLDQSGRQQTFMQYYYVDSLISMGALFLALLSVFYACFLLKNRSRKSKVD